MSGPAGSKAPPRPAFDQLPLDKEGPPGNAWGLFGRDDELGMLNLITPESVLQASKDIRHGIRISTDLPLDRFQPPINNRAPFHHEIRSKTPRPSNDDVLTFNTQSASQWDGFRHYGLLTHIKTQIATC